MTKDATLTDAEVKQLMTGMTMRDAMGGHNISARRLKELLRAERDTKLLADTLREVRKDILMYAEDTLWTHDCCAETIVERINHALDENIVEIDRTDETEGG